MTVLYSIRDWNTHFENAQSRPVKALHWVAMPIKHDGKSFRRIMLREDAGDVFAAWVLIVQVAAKCSPRGILIDDDGPLGPADLAIKTGFPEAKFAKSLNILSSKEIGWLLSARYEPSINALPIQDRQDRTDPTNQPTNSTPARSHSAQPDDAETELAGGRAGGFLSGWGKVADRLTAMGCSRWRETIAEAKAAGCNPGLALTLIDYGKSKGYGTGGIVCRLVKARPTLPVEEGWPAKPPAPQPAAKRKDPSEEAELLRYTITKEGRKAGKTQEQIDADLTAAGLDA